MGYIGKAPVGNFLREDEEALMEEMSLDKFLRNGKIVSVRRGEGRSVLKEKSKKEDYLYCYARPDAMVDHEFTDDVAICRATSMEEAIEKFSSLYDDVNIKYITKCDLNELSNPIVLTDY